MKNKIVARGLALLTVLAITACTGRGTGNISETDSTTTEPEIPIEQLFLPDTSYTSVEVVKYVIEDEDSVAAPLKDWMTAMRMLTVLSCSVRTCVVMPVSAVG